MAGTGAQSVPRHQSSRPDGGPVAIPGAGSFHHHNGEPELASPVKWAGGKRQLLPVLLELLPSDFATYHEPFVGGGALFFELCRLDRIRIGAQLCDLNERLITLYGVIRNETDALVDALEDLSTRTFREAYVEARREFNGPPKPPSLRSAALFLYLNRLCFNGLYRVNRRGDFNVPFGRYANPDVVRAPFLRSAARALGRAEIACQDFEAAMARASAGDVVYFDPPYMPISATSSFTAYQGTFGVEDQERLARTCRDLDRRGVRFMLSNSAHERILELYEGFDIRLVQARRAINSVGARRGLIDEVIVRNYQ